MNDLIFETCLICDLFRPEINQKVSLLGFFGRLPYVTIQVPHADQPILDLSFLCLSKPVEIGTYRIGFSVKDPNDVVMFPMAEQTATVQKPNETISMGFSFRPLRLTGAGLYKVILMVNDKVDLQTSFSVVAASD